MLVALIPGSETIILSAELFCAGAPNSRLPRSKDISLSGSWLLSPGCCCSILIWRKLLRNLRSAC